MPEFLELACMAIGVPIVLAAFLLSKRWQDRPPVKLGVDKIGTVEMDITPFLVLTGLIFAGAGLFFRWQDYTAKIAELSKIQNQVTELRGELESFKNYEMNVALSFPETVDTQNLTTETWRKGSHDATFHQDPAAAQLGKTEASNVLAVKLESLNPGDRVFFSTRETVNKKETRHWRSDTLEVPVAALAMREDEDK